MHILAIETSCDETAIALVKASGGFLRPRFKVLKNLVSSQVKIHAPFGGVVPNLAKREHVKNLPILWKRIMNYDLRFKNKTLINRKSKFLNQIDVVAVTVGPGLEPALWTGIQFAKSLANSPISADENADKRRYIRENPRRNPRQSAPTLVGVNHLEGHLFSFLLPGRKKTEFSIFPGLAKRSGVGKNQKLFPAIALIASGGHTILLKMESLKKWRRLGETRDDAVGESFDKVARMLGLPYPGGPEIEKIAKRGNPEAIKFPRPMIDQKNYDFSFSGLKTAVLYFLQKKKIKGGGKKEVRSKNKRTSPASRPLLLTPYSLIPDIAASFQRAAIDVLISKTIRAAKEFRAKSITLSGGVAANKLLRSDLARIARRESMNFFAPDFKYNLDNAAMIAVAAYFAYLKKKRRRLKAQGNLGV